MANETEILRRYRTIFQVVQLLLTTKYSLQYSISIEYHLLYVGKVDGTLYCYHQGACFRNHNSASLTKSLQLSISEYSITFSLSKNTRKIEKLTDTQIYPFMSMTQNLRPVLIHSLWNIPCSVLQNCFHAYTTLWLRDVEEACYNI